MWGEKGVFWGISVLRSFIATQDKKCTSILRYFGATQDKERIKDLDGKK
jgi:hypothetical protein